MLELYMEQKKEIGVWVDKCLAVTKDSFKVTEKRGTACLSWLFFSEKKRKTVFSTDLNSPCLAPH